MYPTSALYAVSLVGIVYEKFGENLTIFPQEGCIAPHVQDVFPHSKQPSSSRNNHLLLSCSQTIV